ncbi:hypothetical protein PAXRUDRAFT_155964, partial [Paxillus rubicundulus Ve08.2h10]
MSSSYYSSSASNLLWVWNGAYVKTPYSVPGTNIKTSRVLSITVPSHLVELVNPIVVKASDHLLPVDSPEVNSNDTTWGLSDDALQTAIALLWERITTLKVSMTSITNIGACLDAFPYQTHDGKSSSQILVCAAAAEQLNVVKGKAVTTECPVCNKETQNIHAHMGVHILCATRGIIEDVSNPIVEANPCGYCSGPAT